MRKEIRLVDEERGIVQVTTSDERWYTRESRDDATGLPKIEWRGSATYIIGVGMPRGRNDRLERWQSDVGYDAAQLIKREAGARGSKIHLAIADILRGAQLDPKATYWNDVRECMEPLTFSEWGAILSFKRWIEDDCPFEVKGSEFVSWPDGETFATTIDLDLCALKTHEEGRGKGKLVIEAGERFPCDIKSSQNVWLSHKIQVGGAHRIAMKSRSAALLQVGYERNSDQVKFTIIEDMRHMFRACQTNHAYLTSGEEPLQRDYPLTISFTNPPLKNETP